MTNINKIDQYENIKSITRQKKSLHSFPEKNIKIDFKQDYMLSSKIQQYINSTNNDLSNSSIRFLDTVLNINTMDQKVGLKLSFIINSLLFSPEDEKPVNYNFQLELLSVPFLQQDGSYYDFDDQLFKSINKLVKFFDLFSKEKNISLDQFNQNNPLFQDFIKSNNPQLVAYLNDIISLIYAKGKFRKGTKPGFLYDKAKSNKKMYIPYYRLDPDNLELELEITEQIKLPAETVINKNIYTNNDINSIQQWLIIGQELITKMFIQLNKKYIFPFRRAFQKVQEQIFLSLFRGKRLAIFILVIIIILIFVVLYI